MLTYLSIPLRVAKCLPDILVMKQRAGPSSHCLCVQIRICFQKTQYIGRPESQCGQVRASQLWSQSSQAFVNFNNNNNKDTLTTNPSSHPVDTPTPRCRCFWPLALRKPSKDKDGCSWQAGKSILCHCIGWFVGILIMADCKPNIIGVCSDPSKFKRSPLQK